MKTANEMNARTKELIPAEIIRLALETQREKLKADARWESAIKFCEKFVAPVLDNAGCVYTVTLPNLFEFNRDNWYGTDIAYGNIGKVQWHYYSLEFSPVEGWHTCHIEKTENALTVAAMFDKETLVKYLETLGYKVKFVPVVKHVASYSASGKTCYYDEDRIFYQMTLEW